jgi:GH15 family glucan-1,4-alpha-glucosidase
MTDTKLSCDYLPIRDYAAIGDCHGSALVGSNGSIDWCCLERFDADPVFFRMLDAPHGGLFQIEPQSEYHIERAYMVDTNILQTVFHTSTGSVRVTDFMPVGRKPESSSDDNVLLNAPHWLVRIVEGLAGTVNLRVRYRPSGPGFPTHGLALRATANGVAGTDEEPCLYTDLTLSVSAAEAESAIEVPAKKRLRFVVTPHLEDGRPQDHVEKLFEISKSYWQEWVDQCCYQGRYADAVHRSALALKLLTYAPTGAVVAAPTTSLPEALGGERNWDYRYSWLRDSTFTLYALAALGYHGEAHGFNQFLPRCLKKTFPEVRIMYGIDAETDLGETDLNDLQGYCDSAPVRVGNGAYKQRQLDVYGEVLDWALLYRSYEGDFEAEESRVLRSMADDVADSWQEPGQGIWETRSAPRHHVYGKMMCWVALDRAIRLFGSNPRWETTRQSVLNAILERGIDSRGGYLKQAFDSEGIDAAVLMAPMLGFPLERETLSRTVDVVQSRLCRNGYVHRYADSDDGFSGTEGAFLMCSFWLVDAMLYLDRYDQAVKLFEQLLDKTNDVGLFSEEIDPESDAFLGNFPQAFTLLAVIRSAFAIHLYEGGGADALAGSHWDRAHRRTDAVDGVRPLWADFRKARFDKRPQFSQASVLSPFWVHGHFDA